jgi:hypothetical protein
MYILSKEFSMTAAATERIVVQATPKDKRSIVAKAKKLDIPISELMRRGAFQYESDESDIELNALAVAAKRAADNASASIEDALSFIAASNKRIAAMEANATSATKSTKAAKQAVAR